jgi:hypothetical protein
LMIVYGRFQNIVNYYLFDNHSWLFEVCGGLEAVIASSP